eukprot:g3788.t1
MTTPRILYLLLVVLCVAKICAGHYETRTLLKHHTRHCKRACASVARTDPEVLRGLLNRGIDLCNCACNVTTGAGLLHTSVQAKCGLCIDLLTEPPSNCSCNALDENNSTALHYAAGQCRMEITDDLLKAGCNVTLMNTYNNTALCVASRTDNENCGGVVRSLMAAGGDACKTCYDNQTAIEGSVNPVVSNVMNEDLEEECE